MKDDKKILAQNKKAWHDYFIEDSYEAGISLSGTEVKSIRLGKANLKDSYASVYGGEIFIHGMHISPYEQGNTSNKDPMRIKKLLMHKHEIYKLGGLVSQKGMSLIPLKAYFSGNKVKIEIGVAKGKKQYDKRQDIAKKDAQKQMNIKLKQMNR